MYQTLKCINEKIDCIKSDRSRKFKSPEISYILKEALFVTSVLLIRILS